MRRERGWTLIELMGSLSVIGAVSVVVGGLALHAERTRDLGAAYASDVAETRRTLDAVERDLRSARDVRIAGPTLAIATEDGDVAWSLDGRALSRQGVVVARNVAAFETARDGDLVTACVRLGRRSPDATRTASVATTVRLRSPRESAR